MIMRPRHRPDRYGRYVFFICSFLFLPILRRVREEQCVSACDHNQVFLSVSFFLQNPIVSE